jgi:hypothetical protein
MFNKVCISHCYYELMQASSRAQVRLSAQLMLPRRKSQGERMGKVDSRLNCEYKGYCKGVLEVKIGCYLEADEWSS